MKKQWAGMMFKYLSDRKDRLKVDSIASSLISLTDTTEALRSLVGSLHDKEVGVNETKFLIDNTKISSRLRHFYNKLFVLMVDSCVDLSSPDSSNNFALFLDVFDFDQFLSIKPEDNLYDYLSHVEGLVIEIDVNMPDDEFSPIGGIGFSKFKVRKIITQNSWIQLEKLYVSYVYQSSDKLRVEAIQMVYEHINY